MPSRSLFVLGVTTLMIACSADPSSKRAPVSANQDGRALYEAPHPDGNTFACASCHALSEPASDGLRRPGHQIGDAAQRPSYKNGELTSLLEAVNTCRTEWMGATAFRADDDRWVALSAFLQEEAGDTPAPALNYDIVDPPADISGGDMMAGQALFNGSCAVCHGSDAVGTQRAPILVGEFLTDELIANRVRRSGRVDSAVYQGLTGGRMPFWSASRLSDNELRDIIAFVRANDPRTIVDPGNNAGDVDAGVSDGGGGSVDAGGTLDAGGGGGCPATHPSVGRTATLRARSHGVGGTATIIDDCTIEITNFSFDGLGIDVRFYSGLGGNYDDGFSMSDDLRRRTPYLGETVLARLPAGRTLDELDGISVWCVPVGVSFGDGLFQ